jgi:hypothetical protein
MCEPVGKVFHSVHKRRFLSKQGCWLIGFMSCNSLCAMLGVWR